MKLGDLICEYRTSHGLSQRQFANACGLSNGYISMLEKGINPSTKKPVTPTIPQLKKLAEGMCMTVMELLDSVDDMPIDITGTVDSMEWDSHVTPDSNVIRIAARDGSFRERRLSDQQLSALLAILDQMPDVPDDL